MMSDSVSNHKNRKRLLHKVAKVVLIFLIALQIIVIPLMYYERLITPEFLGSVSLTVPVNENQEVNSVYGIRMPNSTFFILQDVVVYDKNYGGYHNATELWLKNDTEFRWFAEHLNVTLYVWASGSSSGYPIYRTRVLLFINASLKDFIENVEILKSNMTTVDWLAANVIVWVNGFINASTYNEFNATKITNRFSEFGFIISIYRWRNEQVAFNQISEIVYVAITVDILLLVVIEWDLISRSVGWIIKKISEAPSKIKLASEE